MGIEGKKFLLVDDDVEFQQSLSGYLMNRGAFVVPTKTSGDFLLALEKENPDVLLIDKEIGFEDGFDLIHQIRRLENFNKIPIIVITGQANEANKIEAIQIGADDLLPKPVNLQDLELRAQAVLRRSHSYLTKDSILSLKGIQINLREHRISIHGEPIELTKTEYKIFLELAIKRDQIISREAVAQKFLSLRNQSPRTIDVHVTSLRKKLKKYGTCIKTIRGRGYMFHFET